MLAEGSAVATSAGADPTGGTLGVGASVGLGCALAAGAGVAATVGRGLAVAVAAAVGAGVGGGVVAACTTTVPVIEGWMVQRYANVPGAVNVKENDCP